MTDERHSATLSTRGRVTLPRTIRERLSLRSGDRLQFELRADGTLEAHVATGECEAPAGRGRGGQE